MRTIYIHTHGFPEEKGEVFLKEETEVALNEGHSIVYCPYKVHSNKNRVLNRGMIQKPMDKWKALKYVVIDLFNKPSILFKNFRYNIVLVSERVATARYYAQKLEKNAIIYTYWFDDLAIMARFIREFRPDITWISRAHAFDVYGDIDGETVLFFKRGKLSHINRLFVVSKKRGRIYKKAAPRCCKKNRSKLFRYKTFWPFPNRTRSQKACICNMCIHGRQKTYAFNHGGG